ncbi:MAG: MarR family transcriptional regulator [Verrucomicrobiales bacterium]|nr:MarR family transcriptional regulator [Verrucomicrobiales bacterium]
MSEPATETTARYRALIQLLRTAEDLWNASRVFFAPWNLSPSQFNVLNVLYGQPDGLSQSDLSRVLIMHRSNVTGLIDRLEKRGLVQRAAHDTDRRAYRLLLTPSGLQLLQAILPAYHRAADAVWAEFRDADAETLLLQLQSVAGNALAVAHLNTASNLILAAPQDVPAPPLADELASGSPIHSQLSRASHARVQAPRKGPRATPGRSPDSVAAANSASPSATAADALRTSDL